MIHKFNSQVCTDINQSNKLLGLGLKPETADCVHFSVNDKEYLTIIDEQEFDKYDTPAWSLHRLMELQSTTSTEGYVIVLNYDNTYDDIIEEIEWSINKGYFNKEYLNE